MPQDVQIFELIAFIEVIEIEGHRMKDVYLVKSDRPVRLHD
jgi:hypothetical protein